jgi:hypothetical protein
MLLAQARQKLFLLHLQQYVSLSATYHLLTELNVRNPQSDIIFESLDGLSE